MIFVATKTDDSEAVAPSWAEDALPNLVEHTAGQYVKGSKIIGMTLTERHPGQWLLTVRIAVQESIVPPEAKQQWRECMGLFVAFEGASSPMECLDKFELAMTSGDVKLRPDMYMGGKGYKPKKK